MKMRLVLAMVLLSIGPAQNAIWGADRDPVAMRPLRVVEARRAIHGPAPVTIEEPGSYYLASNIEAAGLPAVIIKAPDVNLDLNGFTIAGSQDNLGVVLGDNTLDVVLRNGTIRNFAQGLINAGVTSVTLSNLTIAENLRNGVGIDRGGVGVFIDGCTIVRNGEHGILAVGAHVVITNSDVTNNGFDGIALLESASVTVQGNRVSDNGRSGIHAAILFQGDSAPYGHDLPQRAVSQRPLRDRDLFGGRPVPGPVHRRELRHRQRSWELHAYRCQRRSRGHPCLKPWRLGQRAVI